MIEAEVDSRLGRRRLDELAIQPGPRHGVDRPLAVRAVRLERGSPGGVVQDAATHREGLAPGPRPPGPARSSASIPRTDRARLMERPASEIGAPRVRTTLVERDLVSAPGEEDREEGSGESGTHDRDPGVWHRLDRSASGGTMAG